MINEGKAQSKQRIESDESIIFKRLWFEKQNKKNLKLFFPIRNYSVMSIFYTSLNTFPLPAPSGWYITICVDSWQKNKWICVWKLPMDKWNEFNWQWQRWEVARENVFLSCARHSGSIAEWRDHFGAKRDDINDSSRFWWKRRKILLRVHSEFLG